MKKKSKIFIAFLIGCFSIISFIKENNKSKPESSLLNLMNIEALAEGEIGNACKWRTGHSSLTGWIAICDTYGVGYNCKCGDVKYY